MATNTTNYKFKKPDESEFYSVKDQNDNWDKADTALKDLDTPTFEDYSGSTTVPDAAAAIENIKSKGKLSTILSNVKAAFKGACLIGQIVNNCVTNNAKLPLSAAQGKALMDLYTALNNNLAFYHEADNATDIYLRDAVQLVITRNTIRTGAYVITLSLSGGSQYTLIGNKAYGASNKLYATVAVLSYSDNQPLFQAARCSAGVWTWNIYAAS